MQSNIRELAVNYPFILEQPVDALKKILDIRLVVPISIDKVNACGDDSVSLILTGIADGNAYFDLDINCTSPSHSSAIIADVIIGLDTIPDTPALTSFVRLSEDITLTDVAYRVHPDCITIVNRPQSIGFSIREDLTKDLEPLTEDYEEPEDDVLRIKDGNNVSVMYIDGRLMFNCAAGAGLGAYAGFPFVKRGSDDSIEPYDIIDGPRAGLRDINGQHGQISITGDRNLQMAENYTSGSALEVAFSIQG